MCLGPASRRVRGDLAIVKGKAGLLITVAADRDKLCLTDVPCLGVLCGQACRLSTAFEQSV